MDRKAIARQTLDIMEKGWYETEGAVVEIRARQQESVKNSVLFTPEQGKRLLEQYETVSKKTAKYKCCTWNCSTVDAFLSWQERISADALSLILPAPRIQAADL